MCSKFCQILIGPFNLCQSRFNFFPSGEILPNLVTLIEKPPLTTSPPSFAGLGSRKCDQMARWFVQFWPFTAMSIFPISLRELPMLNILPTTALFIFPIVTKFRQIWSHWYQEELEELLCSNWAVLVSSFDHARLTVIELRRI